MFVCADDDSAGRYYVDISGSYENYSYGDGLISGSGSFKLRAAKTRTNFSVSTKTPKFNQVVRLSVHAQVQGKRGYTALKYGTARMQVRVAGAWENIKVDFFTGGNGKDSTLLRWNLHQTYTFRVKTFGEDGHKSSVSNSITINPRG